MGKQQKVDEFFLFNAYVNSSRSKCIKRKVGAVITIGYIRVSDGYNGTPRNIKNCNEGGCPRCNDPTIPSGQNLDKCICIHAESNAILNSFRKLNGTTLYSTVMPCLYCTKEIIQAGIVRVVYDETYSTSYEAANLFKEAKIECVQLSMDPDKKKTLLDLLLTK